MNKRECRKLIKNLIKHYEIKCNKKLSSKNTEYHWRGNLQILLTLRDLYEEV